MQETITSDRLVMEVLRTQDHAFIRELVNTEGWLQYIGDRNIHSDEDAIRYIQRIQNTPDITYWVVRIKETCISVGLVSFIKRTYLDHFDIGFAFLPQYAGLGYAYEATKEVLSVLQSLPQHTIILATTVPHNVKSIVLLKKLGFQYLQELDVETVTLHIYTSNISV